MSSSSTSRPGGPGASGRDLPALHTAVPGPESRAWLARFGAVAAPMGPKAAWVAPDPEAPGGGSTVVYHDGIGSNVIDADGNRFVDLAAGFGSLLLGHRPAAVCAALEVQSGRLLQSLGDVHPSDVKIRLLERLAARVSGAGGAAAGGAAGGALSGAEPAWQGILGQSGADALSAALKTAALHTGRSGVVAFAGAYHGLSYGPLALCGLRQSYRAPFAAQLNPGVRFVDYPASEAALAASLAGVRHELSRGDVGALVFEPILGRGGVIVPPPGFAASLGELCREHGVLFVADEVWTGLGRSGQWLFSVASGARPDVVCLGKGLGGGLPISACLAPASIMAAWSQSDEVVHTSTFAGAPLAAAGALATLDTLEAQGLVERSERVGAELAQALRDAFPAGWLAAGAEVRGSGLMLGIDLGPGRGGALALQRELLADGFITSLGGTRRESLVLTPALDIDAAQLSAFVAAFAARLRAQA